MSILQNAKMLLVFNKQLMQQDNNLRVTSTRCFLELQVYEIKVLSLVYQFNNIRHCNTMAIEYPNL